MNRISWGLVCARSLHDQVTSVLLEHGANLDVKTTLQLLVSKAELEVLLDDLQAPRPHEVHRFPA